MLDIILFSENTETTNKTIASVMADDMYKKGMVTVYLMDFTGNPENQPTDRVVYKDVSGKTYGEVFNEALDISEGDCIAFVTDDGCYEKNALAQATEALKDYKIVSLLPFRVTEEGKSKYISFSYYFADSNVSEINLQLFPEKFHMCFGAYVFRKSVFENIRFDSEMPFDSQWKVFLEIMDKEQKYALINSNYLYSEADENDYFNFLPQFEKEWYTVSMDRFIVEAVKEGASRFRQRFVLYMIACRYACNMNERDKSVLSPEEADDFIRKTSDAVANIEDVIISDNLINGKARLPQFFALNLLRMKYKNDRLLPEIVSSAKNLFAYYNDCSIWSLGSNKIEVKSIYFDGKNLIMDGFFPGIYVFSENEMEIVAVVDKQKTYPVIRNRIYSLNKFFNISAKNNYTFRLSMPADEIHDKMTLTFNLVYKNRYYPVGVTFIRAQTKLSNVKNSYWVFDKHILTYNQKGKNFLFEKLTKKSLFRHERAFIKTILKSTKGMWRVKMVGNRLLYWVSKPFYSKKKIWITMDKLFKAGDNGEYFYDYVKKMKPEGVKIYYVVQKNSSDYKRLKKKYNTILEFNSIKHKMIALHTDLMLATHVDTLNCNGYYAATQKYFKDLYNARVVCLAHGLTIQQIAQYQNRVFDNTVLYFFASKYEIENVSHEVYDYYDKDALKLTGHARYDGLKSNDRKIILITPTWRRGVTTGKASKGSTYAHSDSFKNSEYFRLYNSLINDPELIAKAKEHGYKIVYLLHPAMSNQLEDFDKNDYVDIVAATSDISYEQILTESSLMVTDYSGVQFDFAYMKKPLVYYHPDSLPPQYEAGGLKYDTMGFGPVCTNHGQIVDCLCSYIERSCAMEEKYKARVEDFFEYSDHNNCARIYDEVIKFQNKFDKVNKHNFK